jgi:hypothetical protein
MRLLLIAVPILVIAPLFITGCAGVPSSSDPILTDQKFDLETYFDGQVAAQGQFQDLFGTVRRQFTVDITGDWDGKRLLLVEDFVYEDGSTEQRTWTLTKTADDTWQGTAPGVIGIATGLEQGDRFNWKYTIDLPVPSADGPTETMRVTFDDWMWLQDKDNVFNRAYVSRFGIRIGEALISFRKIN